MSEPLGQSVVVAMERTGNVTGVNFVTYVAAYANVAEKIQPIIGLIVLCVTFGISVYMSRKRDKLLDAQLRAINERSNDGTP